MSGWFDDFLDGVVDPITALGCWLNGEESPSEQADEKCGYQAKDACWYEAQEEAANDLY